MKNFFKNIQQFLPLTVTSVVYEETNLLISGKNWNFNTNGSWRIIDKEKLIFGCCDSESSNIAELITNCKIIEVKPQSTPLAIDPVLIFDNNLKLEIFSTTYFEPWIFALPKEPVYVASPSDPKYL